MIGIYKITNLLNNKSYIGQSINIANRWTEHKRVAFKETDKAYNYPLYRAIRKYGLENFIFEVLEECSEPDLNDREMYWISFFNTFNDGYNLTPGGGGQRKYEIQQILNIYKENNSISATAKVIGCHPNTIRKIVHSFGFYEEEPEAKIIEQIDPSSMQVIMSYPSIRSAAQELHLDPWTISKAVQGKTTNAGGFYWKEKGVEKEFVPIKKLWKRKVQQLDKDTSQVIAEFNSCADAARALGKDGKNGGSSIARVCRGEKISAFNYKWKYI